MTRWIIPAPVWNTGRLMHGDKRLGSYHRDKDNPNFWAAWFDQDGVATYSPDTYLLASEARAWVEAKAMEALGATVLPDMPELSPADTIMTPDDIWNEAIEAACSAVSSFATVSELMSPGNPALAAGLSNAADALAALKRGAANE